MIHVSKFMVHTALSDKTYLSLELLSPITILRRNYCLSKPTIKPVISGHAKIDKTKILLTDGSLMKVESIAECSHWSILQYVCPVLSDNRS